MASIGSQTERFAVKDAPTETGLDELAANVSAWFQYPEATEARVSSDDVEAATDGYEPVIDKYQCH